MKILIDTNILIHLEDNKIISDKFARFYRLAISNNCKILYHPRAIPVDLTRDNDTERRNITISKLQKYECLENFAILPTAFNQKLGYKKDNDTIDNLQLYQLYKEYVDFFITEDNGIHEKAKSINLSKNVLKVDDILELLEEHFTIKIPSHPILKEHSIRDIENKFNEKFFDSLREDYGKIYFNNWLNKCVQENRKCYTLQVNNEIRAILIYNIEEVIDHQINDVYEKMMKICTLKVADTVFGVKLGELFINKMFEYCINQRIKYLYLTVYEKQEHLINLLQKFGFYRRIFINKQGLEEIQMIKQLDKSKIKPKENIVTNHPFYLDNQLVSKFAIPIQPNYYCNLFKDGQLRQPTLFDYSLDSINEIQGNTVFKAYISGSKITTPKPGDLLFFYASKTNKVIEPVGILESINIIDNFEDLWNIVNKKTVFTQTELHEMLNKKKKLNVITFRLVTYLKKKVDLQKISKLNSFKNKIQTITRISEIDYLALKNEEYFDRRYIID